MTENTFAEQIEAEADGEEILGICFSSRENNWATPNEPSLVHNWNEVRELFNYKYDAGFGGADCHPITAWTDSKVIFVTHYDGATWVSSIPRNPTSHIPTFFGGG